MIAAAGGWGCPCVPPAARVLMKLGLRDRVAAVVFACEHGMVEPGAGP
jgi:hypothetical protein